ncbi:DUF4126 family protein [Pedobacter psychrophilus]|nr:DUF4126 family protein [Pedobacter psychrophilus]
MKSPLIKTLVLGMSAGMRTMVPLSIMSTNFHKNKQINLKNSKFNFIQTGVVSTLLDMAALGELAGDKNPNIPDRTEAMGVIGRALSGAFVGATIYKASFRNPVNGAVIGAISAVASTFIFFHLRKSLAKKTHNDKILGMAEDALAFTAGKVLK